MTVAFIGIGSNLGDRKRYVDTAMELMGNLEKIKVDKVSPLYETEPVGGPAQGMYLNGVVRIETDYSPRELLEKLMDIEITLGRERTVKNGPRTIDLDILTYGDKKIEEKDLIIPHPRMNERDFVKYPLKDLLNSR
ncbi:MAG: 2-amino-4-hydroxy-6-hydroxymethyldihydropteridine diphosphokinase [Candidatus Omnitrophica bacterium]|nr:2-amino-4-hydroxy-6-hydroxymethyldihydropteridine diphosphokinase [Candidatus Omnitrophota bacterium]